MFSFKKAKVILKESLQMPDLLYLFFTLFTVALKSLPNFKANPSTDKNTVMPHHRCTIHLNCERTELLDEAYLQAKAGLIPDK